MPITAKKDNTDPLLVPSRRSVGTLRYISRLAAHLRDMVEPTFGALACVVVELRGARRSGGHGTTAR
jgi:hypothetical protein